MSLLKTIAIGYLCYMGIVVIAAGVLYGMDAWLTRKDK